MAIESGSNVTIAYVAEVTRGTTPGSPSMKTLRVTERNINPQVNELTSEEYRSDRLAGQSRHGFRSVSGSLGFPLSVVDQDDWLEAALGGTWAAVTGTASATITTNQAGKTYTRATGSFLTDGFLPGDTVDWTGLVQSASNGRKTIASVTATVMTVIEAIGSNETSVAGCACAHPGKRLKIGTTLRTFTVERRFPGVTQFQPFTGVAVNQMSLSVTPENIITGSYSLVGMNFGAMSGTSLGSPSAVSSRPALDGFVGVLYEANAALGLITAFDFTLDNSRTTAPILFSTGSPDIFEGLAKVTGRASVMFQDAVMYNKFVNETSSSLNIRMDEVGGTDFLRVGIPNLTYRTGDMNPPTTGPVILDMQWTANPDATTGTNVIIQRSNA